MSRGITLTETLIRQWSGKSLSEIKELDVSGSKIKRLDAETFRKLTRLARLNLSNNSLQRIPADLVTLDSLRQLDVRDNCLESVEFLHCVPRLEELWLEGNGCVISDKYIAVLFCPDLKTLDGKPTDRLQSIVQHCREKFQQVVDAVWEEEDFSSRLALAGTESSEALEKLVQRVRAKRPTAAGATSPQFRDLLLRKLCAETLVRGALHDSREPRCKKAKSSGDSLPSSPGIASLRHQSARTEGALDFGAALDYDPVHCLRCHSGDKKALKFGYREDNDPRDEITNVWNCAAEPSIGTLGGTTGIVATCGGDTVCLIDCSTGQVMKRFKQPKEQFYALAWATLALDYESVVRMENILAVGGNNGHLKLLHPAQLVCYAEHHTGRPNRAVIDFYYSSLIFHPTKTTWLFCGSSDTTITLFDIGIPTGADYKTDIRQLMVLVTSPASIILNLVFNADSEHLLAGTEVGCAGWLVGAEISKGVGKRSEQTVELYFSEKKKKQTIVDGLVLLDNNRAACKCVSSACIYVFDVKKTLGASTKRAARRILVEPLFCLDWAQTDTDYIGLAYSSGLLACGDDKGSVWLYDIKSLLASKTPRKDRKPVAPSKVLPWPRCEIKVTRELEQQMTDVLDKPEPLVINSLAFTGNGAYMLAVTDCNLVVVYKRIS